MDIFGLAAHFSAIKQNQIALETQTSIMKKAMDMPGDLTMQLLDSVNAAALKSMEISVSPYLGALIDITV